MGRADSQKQKPMGEGRMHAIGPPVAPDGVFFVFTFFKKKFTEIYFRFQNLQIYTPTARPVGGRGPAANWPGGRDLNVNKKICFCMEVRGGDLPPGKGGGRPPLPAKLHQ